MKIMDNEPFWNSQLEAPSNATRTRQMQRSDKPVTDNAEARSGHMTVLDQSGSAVSS